MGRKGRHKEWLEPMGATNITGYGLRKIQGQRFDAITFPFFNKGYSPGLVSTGHFNCVKTSKYVRESYDRWVDLTRLLCEVPHGIC